MRILLLTAWFSILAILGAYSMDPGVWGGYRLPFTKSTVDNRDTITVAPYVYGKTPAVSLGEIKDPEKAYVHLKLHFRLDSTEGHPNVFQTAPVNRGMRMEVSGSTATIIVPDISVPGGLKGLNLTSSLKTGRWYTLDIEALNGSFVRATLDGHLVANYASLGLTMETSQLLVGGGFDNSRAFRGDINNISIKKGNGTRSRLVNYPPEKYETIYSAPYVYGATPEILLGDIKNPESAYMHLKLRFRIDGTEGYPNVFQTAPVNRGMRMEISGSTASIIVPDLSVAEGLKGLALTSSLRTGRWYTLEVKALNGSFVHATLDGNFVVDYASPNLAMETSQLMVGAGFDATRPFRGNIDNISITKGNRLPPEYNNLRIKVIFYFVLLAGLLIIVVSHFSVPGFYIGFISVLLIVSLYNTIIFNGYFPLTEGWFPAYAHLIRQGLVPYRDFYLFLTPLYPMQLSFFQVVFGEGFLPLRIFGVIVVLLISIFLYLILARRFSPLVSVIACLTSIIYYQKGGAHITYDFIQIFTVFVLAAIYLILRYSDGKSAGKQETNQRSLSLLIAAGVMVSLAFLTKQSNGTLIVIFSMMAVALVTENQSFRCRLKNLSAYMMGMAFPVMVTGVWLYFVGAIAPFFDQVVFGAIEAKGTSIWRVLFSWMEIFVNKNFFESLLTALLYLSPLFILGLFKTTPAKQSRDKGEMINKWGVFLFFALCGAIVWFAYYGDDLARPWMIMPGIKLAEGSVAVSTSLVVLLALFSLIKTFASSSRYHSDYAVIAFMTLGLVFGNGTSPDVGEVSVFLCFALTLAFLLSLPGVYGIGKIIISISCLSLILYLANEKFQRPYTWWLMSEADIRGNKVGPELPLLAGFRLSPDSVNVLEATTRIIRTHSRPGDDVFAFPHIPVFYLLADRWPHSKVIVSWFDFLPYELAKAEAKRLLATPPVVIVNLKIPEAVWRSHELAFRGGKPLGQRDIQAAISELTEERKLYQLDLVREISPGSVLEVWHRRER